MFVSTIMKTVEHMAYESEVSNGIGLELVQS
jgi:hypothetical protein